MVSFETARWKLGVVRMSCNRKNAKKAYIRVIRKLQFQNNFLLKTHFCRALARKNARLVREPMGFPNKSIIVLLTVLLAFGHSACDLPSEKGFVFDEKTFISEWDKWEKRNILNYSFTMNGQFPYWNMQRAILMLDYEVNIIVKDGVLSSFEYVGENVPYEEGEIAKPEFTSISDLYRKISERATEEKIWWISNSGNGIISTTLNVKYDSQLNYITFYEPTSNWKSGWIVDTTDHAVRISGFSVLED